MAQPPRTTQLLISPNSDGRGWEIVYVCVFVCVRETVDERERWRGRVHGFVTVRVCMCIHYVIYLTTSQD
uniref:Uncharacterized protein n=1 Tax=Sander lucioperca TaxID=283035 RepID=A0A8C9Y7T9_SANLU